MEQLIIAAMKEIAALLISISGDVHLLHFTVCGKGFDRFHANVFKDYYEQLATDFDEAVELCLMFDDVEAINPNVAASLIGWQSVDGQCVSADNAVQLVQDRLQLLCDKLNVLYKACDEVKDCPKTVAITNWLHGRLEYWVKETNYFNKRRQMS